MKQSKGGDCHTRGGCAPDTVAGLLRSDEFFYDSACLLIKLPVPLLVRCYPGITALGDLRHEVVQGSDFFGAPDSVNRIWTRRAR